MKTLLMLPLLGLVATGTWTLNKNNAAPKTADPAEPTAVQTSAATPRMWTTDKELYRDETLDLHFAAPNPSFLGVINPDGKFFYVVFPEESAIGKLQPLVSSEAFVFLNTLSIPVNSFKADPYTSGIYENKPVFTKSGVYQFILGDNLHTDDPEMVFILKVKYRHAKRPLVAGI